jgi:hypothetical protein
VTVGLRFRAAGAPRPGLPVYVREVLEEARAVRLEPVRARPPPAAGAAVVLSVMRNERPVLGEFLAHYRGLGADRFVVLDNGSTDGTREALAAEPDVDLYLVRRRFFSPRKQGWINRAIARYGYDRWYAYADADEHLTFAGAGSLKQAVAFAEARGLRRLRGMLVDMYPRGPVFRPAPGSLAQACPLFDGEGYHESLCKQRISRKGGPRRRLLGGDLFGFDPELTKYPLFHIRPGEVFDNPHHLHPYGENFASPCHVAILHYKFNPAFARKLGEALATGAYAGGSAEYRYYLAALLAGGGAGLAYPGSRTYRGPANLVSCGLIEPMAPPRPPGPVRRIGTAVRGLGRTRAQVAGLAHSGARGMRLAAVNTFIF